MNNTSWFSGTNSIVLQDIVVDIRLRKVIRPDGEIEITQRVFDLLTLLIAEPHILHSRESLFERVWGTTIVEDANLTQSISIIRKALGDERKSWIRTFSKKGYVFDPPGNLESVATQGVSTPAGAGNSHAERPEAADSDTGPHSHPVRTSLAPHTAGLRPMLSMVVASVLATAMLVLPSSKSQSTSVSTAMSATTDAMSVSIVLAETENPDATATERWATKLLTEWIRWKLSYLPSVTLVQKEDLVAVRTAKAYLLELKVEASSAQPGHFDFVIAFRPMHSTMASTNRTAVTNVFQHTLSLDGGADRLPAMVDAASNDVIARMFPQRSPDQWPPLALDKHTAKTYTKALEAELRHDTVSASALMQEVVRLAPHFGPVRIQLARIQAQKGQYLLASEQAELAHKLSTPLPADAATVLAAEAASMALGNAEKAAKSYAALYANNPAKIAFLLTQSTLLIRANRAEAAMRLLSRPEWQQQQPYGMRIQHRIALSESAMTLGYYNQTREHATEAVHLIGQTGGGWDRELGNAQMLIARAYHHQVRNAPKPELYLAAIRMFETSDYPLGVMNARFLEAMARSNIADAEKQFQPLLASAMENGDSDTEINTLRTMSEIYQSAGMREKSMPLRIKAFEVASLAGDIAARDILDLDLLGEDIAYGNLKQAQHRVDRLRKSRLWTKYKLRLARRESVLLMLHGRHRDALSVIDRNLISFDRTAESDDSVAEVAKLFCARMEALLVVGEPSMAEAQLRGCRDFGSNSIPIVAALGQASIAYQTGNMQKARAHADQANRLLAPRPMDNSYLGMGTTLAGILTRLHDYDRAEHLYQTMYPEAKRMGYALPIAKIEVGLAEIAAVHRDWKTSARYTDAVRKRFPTEPWALSSRLELLEIAREYSTGDIAVAKARAIALTARAERLDDAVMRTQALSLSPASATYADSANDSGDTTIRSLERPEHGKLDWLIAPDTRLGHSPAQPNDTRLADNGH